MTATFYWQNTIFNLDYKYLVLPYNYRASLAGKSNNFQKHFSEGRDPIQMDFLWFGHCDHHALASDYCMLLQEHHQDKPQFAILRSPSSIKEIGASFCFQKTSRSKIFAPDNKDYSYTCCQILNLFGLLLIILPTILLPHVGFVNP